MLHLVLVSYWSYCLLVLIAVSPTYGLPDARVIVDLNGVLLDSFTSGSNLLKNIIGVWLVSGLPENPIGLFFLWKYLDSLNKCLLV